MSKPIIWSSYAEDDLNNLLKYLVMNWDEKVTLHYLDILEELLNQLSNQPKMFPIINRKLKVRKCVITKQNSLYYRENSERIEILRIYDNRQNPRKLRLVKE
jgi:plasmid stabilization system protein ParE